jgi:putative ABC transport system permease protein
MSTFSSILRALTLALVAIAGISLSVAGIGIMNVMLVAVSERTAEVGLLKALGAQRGQILAVFLTEAVLLAAIGGLLGLTIGWGGLMALVTVYPSFPARPPAWAVASAMAVSLVLGAVFGVMPARRAARLDPVDALERR